MNSMTPHEAEQLVQKLEQLSERPPSVIIEDDGLRRRFREAAYGASLAVHAPSDTVHLIAYGALYSSMAKVGVDTKLFEVLVASGVPLSSEEVAEKTGIEPVLARRLLRFYQSFRWLKETGENKFAANNITKALTPPLSIGIEFFNTVMNPLFAALPEYLKSHNYKNPTTALDSPWQSAYSTTDHPFQWLQAHPSHLSLFMSWMPLERHGNPEFLDVFPFEREIGQNTTDDTVLFVDIGSALGTQAVLVRERFPQLKGRVIVQDLQHVIDTCNANRRPGIETQVYDFFTPQPVRGARAYYMRNIMHDHQDEQAREILRNTAVAFDEKSMLLIDDIVLPESGPVPWRAMMADFNLMSALAGRQRSEREWYKLIEEAGLQVVGIWKYAEETGDSIIAAKRANST